MNARENGCLHETGWPEAAQFTCHAGRHICISSPPAYGCCRYLISPVFSLSVCLCPCLRVCVHGCVTNVALSVCIFSYHTSLSIALPVSTALQHTLSTGAHARTSKLASCLSPSMPGAGIRSAQITLRHICFMRRCDQYLALTLHRKDRWWHRTVSGSISPTPRRWTRRRSTTSRRWQTR